MESLSKLLDFTGASTVNVALKLALLIAFGIGMFFFRSFLRKRAFKLTEKAKNEAMAELPSENSEISEESTSIEQEIDSLLNQ